MSYSQRARIMLAVAALGAGLSRASQALALAGGGSSHFGGGGFGGGGLRGGGFGGGGFGGGGFGRGIGYGVGFGLGRHAGGIALGLLLLIIAVVVLVALASLLGGLRYRRMRRQRTRRVELAAREAAQDDSEFDPDTVHAEAEQLFRSIEQAWSTNDRRALSQLVGPDLMVEWNRRLDDLARRGWRNQVDILGRPQIEYVGLTNRESDREDRVVVRLTARMRDVVFDSYGNELLRAGSRSEMTTMCEYWTLGKRDGHWYLLSIEQRREGDHQLAEEIVPTPWSDTERLSERSVVEQAVGEKPPEGSSVADIAPAQFSGEARAAALDLSLVDGRFAPDVLAAEVRRAVAAWAEAVDGSDSDLRRLASGRATRELLHPGDASARTRLVVRGPQVRRVEIVALDAHHQPATMTVELKIHGRRYLEDRDTAAILAGSQGTATAFSERWTLALDGDDEFPWRITDAAAPASV